MSGFCLSCRDVHGDLHTGAEIGGIVTESRDFDSIFLLMAHRFCFFGRCKHYQQERGIMMCADDDMAAGEDAGQ